MPTAFWLKNVWMGRWPKKLIETWRILSGFWVRCRVCGDRSVLVTSHHPARSSRALCSAWFELCFSHLRYFPFAIFLFDGSACLLLFTLLFKVSLLGFYHVFLCAFHTPPPLISRVQRTASTATLAFPETVSYCAVLRHLIGAHPSNRACVPSTS